MHPAITRTQRIVRSSARSLGISGRSDLRPTVSAMPSRRSTRAGSAPDGEGLKVAQEVAHDVEETLG